VDFPRRLIQKIRPSRKSGPKRSTFAYHRRAAARNTAIQSFPHELQTFGFTLAWHIE